MIPQEALDVALGEIREVMVQYTNCADPSESAALKERLRLVETQGQLESSAAQMVRASLARKVTEMERPLRQETQPQDRLPIAARLGPAVECIAELETEDHTNLIGESDDRIHVSNRLGPLPMNPPREIVNSSPARTLKRKPGRPPGRKTVASSPNPLQGGGSRKRKTQQIKPPNCRKKLVVEEQGEGKATRQKRAKGESSRAVNVQDNTATSSDNVPLTNMIPRISKRRMDFRNPSSHVP